MDTWGELENERLRMNERGWKNNGESDIDKNMMLDAKNGKHNGLRLTELIYFIYIYNKNRKYIEIEIEKN